MSAPLPAHVSEAIFEAADVAANPSGYADDVDEANRRGAMRDRLASAFSTLVVWETSSRETLAVPIPYNLRADELATEPNTNEAEWFSELSWLQENANDDEAARILTAAVVLWHARFRDLDPPTLGDCLYTAIVWERG